MQANDPHMDSYSLSFSFDVVVLAETHVDVSGCFSS